MILFSELNLELIRNANLARLSGCSLGFIKVRSTPAPLPHISWPLMSWLMIICCWKTS